MNSSKKSELMAQLNKETAKMPWLEMQKFFANGSVVFIHESLDLVDAAAEIALDNKVALQTWMQESKVVRVSDELAAQWLEVNQLLWSVVVAPWVLVQIASTKNAVNNSANNTANNLANKHSE